MAEFPALTFWTDAYLADTRHLTTVEHGAYLLLLIEAWRRPRCDLPDDDAVLARLAGLTQSEWEAVRTTVLAFWRRDGRSRTWSQKRLLKERDRARVRSKSASDKAIKRWSKREKIDAAALPSGCPDDATTATATATSSVETNVSTAAAAASDLFDHAEYDGAAGTPPAPAQVSSAADIKRTIFASGLALLIEQGIPEPRARSMIGRWRKDHSDGAVLDALSRAATEQPSAVLEWISGRLNHSKGQRNGHAPNGPGPMQRLGAHLAAEFTGDR